MASVNYPFGLQLTNIGPFMGIQLDIIMIIEVIQWLIVAGIHIRTSRFYSSLSSMSIIGFCMALYFYHVVSHTDTKGMRKILEEINRVLKPGGEVYLMLCSKETWSFKGAGYPKLDENTVVKTEEGSEKGVPHFYVDLDDILELFHNFEIERIRHTDDCYFNGQKQNSKHYFILAKKIKK